MRKWIIALALLLLLLAGCGTERQTRYVVLFSGGQIVAQVPTNTAPIYYSKTGFVTITLPDGHWIRWFGDYLVTDVPVEDAQTLIDLMGG